MTVKIRQYVSVHISSISVGDISDYTSYRVSSDRLKMAPHISHVHDIIHIFYKFNGER